MLVLITKQPEGSYLIDCRVYFELGTVVFFDHAVERVLYGAFEASIASIQVSGAVELLDRIGITRTALDKPADELQKDTT